MEAFPRNETIEHTGARVLALLLDAAGVNEAIDKMKDLTERVGCVAVLVVALFIGLTQFCFIVQIRVAYSVILHWRHRTSRPWWKNMLASVSWI